MFRWLLLGALAGVFVLPLDAGVQAAQLKNLETSDLCVYWILDQRSTTDHLLADLTPVSTRFQRLAPGESARIDLADTQSLVVVFVPWNRRPESRAPVRGVLLVSAELASGKQLGLVGAGLWASHPEARLEAPLSDWGLSVPQLALDGSFQDWQSVPETGRWPTVSPDSGRPLSVQIRVADQALWIHARLSPASFSEPVSWVFKGSSVFWELFPRGSEARIWQFLSDGSSGRAVGLRRLVGDDLEAWIPLERLKPEHQAILAAGHWQWRLVEAGENPDNSLLLDVTMGDLP